MEGAVSPGQQELETAAHIESAILRQRGLSAAVAAHLPFPFIQTECQPANGAFYVVGEVFQLRLRKSALLRQRVVFQVILESVSLAINTDYHSREIQPDEINYSISPFSQKVQFEY